MADPGRAARRTLRMIVPACLAIAAAAPEAAAQAQLDGLTAGQAWVRQVPTEDWRTFLTAPGGNGSFDYRGGEFGGGVPGGWTFAPQGLGGVFMAPPGAIFGDGMPGPVPLAQAVPQDQRSLVDPAIGAGQVGFFNTSGGPLTFTITLGPDRRVLELVAREVRTVDLPAGVAATGVISTGDIDETVTLAGGTLYLLKGDNGRWVFAEF